MYRPYVSFAARTAQAFDKADSVRQREWLENAIADGSLPTHEPRQPTGIADPADDDPPAPVLRAAQQALATANRAGRAREAKFLRRRKQAYHAMRKALETQQTSPPSQLASANAEVERCRRSLISLSGNVPTSSDEEVGRFPLGTFGRIKPRPDSSDEEYHSTTSTSSGGSSTRDLELKASLWTEYQKHPRPHLGRALHAHHWADGGTRGSNLKRGGHDVGCHQLRERMDHCNCRKEARDIRRQARREQCVARWFAAKRVEDSRYSKTFAKYQAWDRHIFCKSAG
ncbi:hypothetical protein B0H14DRAFT_3536426 [Mycena olivaceomarginata]|nr:hypothetical protein B0H14DRAFT_3536426 [Mycena olivaceomarginata]